MLKFQLLISTNLVFFAISNCFSQSLTKVIARNDAVLDGCFRSDGGISESPEPTSEVVPYFANFIAVRWAMRGKEADLDRVSKYLTWCQKHQNGDGTIDCYGYAQGPPTRLCDADDSELAGFIWVADTFVSHKGKLTEKQIAALQKAFDHLQHLMRPSGLTWGRDREQNFMPSVKGPDGRPYNKRSTLSYLQDNLEAYAGFASAQHLFTTLGDTKRKSIAESSRLTVGHALQNMWVPEKKLYSPGFANGVRFPAYTVDMPEYPGHEKDFLALCCLVNLRAITWLDSSPVEVKHPGHPWVYCTSKFIPDGGNFCACPTEYFYMASLRVGKPDEIAKWKHKTIAESDGFGSDTYGYRPAICNLALLYGTNWIPNWIDDQQANHAPKGVTSQSNLR